MRIKPLLITAVLAIAVLGFANFTTAAQDPLYQDYLYSETVNSIHELSSKIHSSFLTSSQWCHNFNTNLSETDTQHSEERNKEIFALEVALYKEFSIHNLSVISSYNGEFIFTPAVKIAVIAFQEKYASEILAPYGLTSGNGYVGVSTRAKLNQLYGCAQPSITVTSPNGGETWTQGTMQKITWSAENILSSDMVDIKLYDSSGVNYTNISVTNTGYYTFGISQTASFPTGSYKIKLEARRYSISLASDDSDNYFSIVSSASSLATSFANLPQNQAVSGNQQVEVGKFKFISSGQANTINELRFTANNGQDAVSSVALKDGSVVLATRSWNASGYYKFDGLNILVAANTSKTLTLDFITSAISATAGNSGLDVKPSLVYVGYKDQNGIAYTDTNARIANSTIVYRSVPTLSKVELDNSAPLVNGVAQDLYKFKVSASLQGDVSIKQFKLSTVWNDSGNNDNLEIESIKLLKDGVDITSSVSIMNNIGSSVEGTAGADENLGEQIVIKWDGVTEDIISAGTQTTYTIRGAPQGFNLTGDVADSVSLSLSQDIKHKSSGYNYLNTGTSYTDIIKLYSSSTPNASAEGVSLIWSDDSAVAHSASITSSTNDWTNGYLILDSLSDETWISSGSSIQPNLPDLRVNNIYYYGSGYISVKYCNKGTAMSTGNFLVKLRNEATGKEYVGNPYRRLIVPAIGACSKTTVSCHLIGIACGSSATVSATIDWENTVQESNENNNQLIMELVGNIATDYNLLDDIQSQLASIADAVAKLLGQ